MTAEARLFDRVVAASRVAPVIAPFAVQRLLIRSRVVPAEDVTPEELARVLPEVEEGLRVYLTDEELAEAMAELRSLTRS